MKSGTIRGLIFEDKQSGWWSVQCLEYDIATQAKTLPDLIYEFNRVIMGHIVVSDELQLKPFANMKSAPPVYWQLFNQAKIHVQREPIPLGSSAVAATPRLVSDLRYAELQPA